MQEHHEIYFIALAFVSEVIGTLSGVSSSTLFVPVAKLFESLQVTLVLTAALHVLGNTVRAFLYRENIHWPLVLRFGGPSILFAGLGAMFSDSFSDQFFSLLLGLFLILFASYQLFHGQNFKTSVPWLPYVAGAISGLLTGFLGSGGAIRSLALAAFSLSPVTFIATSTMIDFGGDIVRLGIYLKKDYLNAEHFFYIPILMVVVLVANLLAKKWVMKISQELFTKVIYVFVFIMGFFSLAQSLITFV